MARADSAPPRFSESRTEDLLRWAGRRNTPARRFAGVDELTRTFFTANLLVSAAGWLTAAVAYVITGSWVVLLAAGTILLFPVLGAAALGVHIAGHTARAKQEYRLITAELRRRAGTVGPAGG